MNKMGFGLIGCGRISKNHLESIQAIPEAQLIAVSDNDKVALESAVQKYQCAGYENYQDLLANPDLQVVNICTPSGWHARMALDAMEAGKHVIVEKPMAMSLAEADAMIAAAQKRGVKIAVTHQNRFNRPVVKLREKLEKGKFGRLTHGSAVIRWNRNDQYYEQAPWRGTWAQDGGCLMNQSIHNIDLLQWMMGPVASVFAYTATNLRKIEGEDAAVAVLKFENGAFATIEATTTIFPTNLEETLNVFGTTGSAVLGGIAVNKIESWRFDDEDEKTVLGEQFKEPPNVYGFGHADIIRDCIAAIAEDRDPAVSGTEGRKALEIILGIYHSVRLRKEIQFPLKEEFVIGMGI
ncbi:MAG TPA: Gfo/Idh/MocA family oxidoreductase [Patescibacteria group bacterium]|nr:Gfo/Idh/MocA family oxidoreductase [Patescibacteria group bacterium]